MDFVCLLNCSTTVINDFYKVGVKLPRQVRKDLQCRVRPSFSKSFSFSKDFFSFSPLRLPNRSTVFSFNIVNFSLFCFFISLYWSNTFPLQIFSCFCLLCLNSTHPPLSICFPSHNICNIFLFSFPLLTKYFRSPNIFPLILFFSCADRMYNVSPKNTLWTFSSSQKYTLLQKNPLCKWKANFVLKFPFVARFISRWNEQKHLYLVATSFFRNIVIHEVFNWLGHLKYTSKGALSDFAWQQLGILICSFMHQSLFHFGSWFLFYAPIMTIHRHCRILFRV